ncbi:MAG: helix-turn-helix domain-containing protein [Treponema sp.]|jgi:transcriptional regulator with XRE-family HTH domain|nr:helix-turn-helix domain-containing protein [Treponema sp.]
MEKSVSEKDIRLLFGRNLKRMREMRNISQFSLATMTGLTNAFINDIENCKRGISEKTLAKLSSALNVAPYRFFLPEKIPDDSFSGYVSDFRANINMVLGNLTDQYLNKTK